MPDIRIGISGWTYAPWRGNFYPDELAQKNELAFASRRFNALEINGTFYSLQKPSSFQSWYDATPPHFLFTMKGSRHITHIHRLKDPEQGLANYFASGMLLLREKLGAFLWQFPPNMKFDEDRFRAFFELLPHDTEALARLAERHDDFMTDRAHVDPDAKRRVRHAVEFRHESFLTDRFVDLLREHNIALVIADVASKFPTAEDVTADWVYLRLHGSRELYRSGYEPEEIKAWAEKIRAWSGGGEPPEPRRIGGEAKIRKRGRDVYAFFDNTDVKLRAPVDARAMGEELGVGPGESIEEILAELGASAKAKTGTGAKAGQNTRASAKAPSSRKARPTRARSGGE